MEQRTVDEMEHEIRADFFMVGRFFRPIIVHHNGMKVLWLFIT